MKQFDFTARGDGKPAGRLEMRAAVSGKPASLAFYGDIVSAEWDAWDDTDKCPQAIADFMQGLDPAEPLDVYFNSGGGDVWAGIAIHSILKRHTGHKQGFVDGLAASIASVILMACDDITVNTGAQIMVHKPWCWTAGNSDELLDMAGKLENAEAGMLDIYMTRAQDGVTRETLAGLLKAETWMTGEQAQEYFTVAVEDAPAAAASASGYYPQYRNMPKGIRVAENEALPAEPQNTDDGLPLRLGLADAFITACEIQQHMEVKTV